MDIETRLLTDAVEIIDGRSDTHGAPERNFENIANKWSEYLGVDISAADVAEMMIRLKLARSETGEFNKDDYRDMVSYANFAANFHNE
jgi:hypothetical protein